MEKPLTCLVVSDGRRGIENQALGLAEALARRRKTEIIRHVVTPGKLFRACPPKIQLALKSAPADYGITEMPDLAIGCGRQAIAALRALKKAGGDNVFTVYVQDPRMDTQNFDLVVAPNHDGLTGDNVETMIGSPNRITEKLLADNVLKFSLALAKVPAPRIAVLIGGTSKTHALSRDIHQRHIQAVSTLIDQGFSVMFSTSRRTPDWAKADHFKHLFERQRVWIWDENRAQGGEGQSANPYFAFLGSADAILVTEDSTNMLTEACATGKPVFTLPMSGEPGKFAHLYEALKQRCNVTPFVGDITGTAYQPLDETSRVAGVLAERLSGRLSGRLNRH